MGKTTSTDLTFGDLNWVIVFILMMGNDGLTDLAFG